MYESDKNVTSYVVTKDIHTVTKKLNLMAIKATVIIVVSKLNL